MTFYERKHYVWCAPVYDPTKLEALNIWRRIPTSSNPHKIYIQLLDEVESKDLHSDKIKNNRNGLKRGALAKRADGIIDDYELAKINYMIDNATVDDFRPLLFIIPKHLVDSKIKKVPVSFQANPLSEEYLIEDLEIHECEIIQTK